MSENRERLQESKLTPEQLASAQATYEQRVAADLAWQEQLAERGWKGYISIVLGVVYHASKIVDNVGVRFDGDSEAEVLALIDRVEVP